MIYLVLVLTFRFTLLTSDIAIGRRTQESAIRAYAKMRPKWKFLGVLTFLVLVVIIAGYSLTLQNTDATGNLRTGMDGFLYYVTPTF